MEHILDINKLADFDSSAEESLNSGLFFFFFLYKDGHIILRGKYPLIGDVVDVLYVGPD